MKRVRRRAAAVTIAAAMAAAAWLPAGLTPAPGHAAASAEPIDLGGRDLPGGTGSTNTAEPTELTPGLWRDTLGGTTSAQDEHYFSYRRTIEDSTVHIGVIGASRDPDGDDLDLTVYTRGEESEQVCGQASESPDYSLTHALFGVAVHAGASEPGERDGSCLTTDLLQITINRGSGSSTEDLPIAIKVVEEAPVPTEDLAGQEPPAEDLTYRVPAAGDAEERAGATSFADAPLLDADPDGVTVASTLTEGDEVLYRVPIAWGQQVAAAVRVPALEDEDVLFGPTVDVRLIDPVRRTIAATAEDEQQSGTYGEEPLELSVGTAPLRYLNRYAGVAPTVPGEYWVAIAVQRPREEDRQPLDVPVELTVAVTGDPGDGAPSYRSNVLATGDAPAPDGYGPATPYLVAEGTFAEVASGSPAPLPGDEDGSWWGPRRYAGMAVGGVGLACCLVGAVWLVRRRAA